MRKFLWVTAVAMPLLFAPSQAHAWGWGGGCFPCGVGIDAGAHFNVYNVNTGFIASAAPWYTYYPYEAYFQVPAPYPSYPYWVGSSSIAVSPAPVLPAVPIPPTVPGGQLPPPIPGPAGAPVPAPIPGPAR